MTHLKVEQNTGTIEQVDKSVIAELYELLAYNVLDSSSNLQGRIHTSATYQEYIDYIRAKYPDLYITSDNIYIKFADSAVENVLKNAIGDGIGVTLAQAQATTNSQISSVFSNNTNITQFDELRFFTSVTNMPTFNGCTNLQHIQIPPSLKYIQYSSLNNCTALTSIGDTSNVESFNPQNSYNFNALRLDQTKLQSLTGIFNSKNTALFNSDEIVTISAPGLTQLDLGHFGGKELIITSPITQFYAGYSPNVTRIVLPETCKRLSGTTCINCSNLTSINLENVEYIGQQAFSGTKITEINISSLTSSSSQAFNGLNNVNITLPSNNWGKDMVTNNESLFSRCWFSSITNLEVLANYDYAIKELPFFANYSPVLDVINFAKATSFQYNGQYYNYLSGLASKYQDKYLKQWYSPKLLTVNNYNLGMVPYWLYQNPSFRFRCKLIYLKDVTSFSNFAFGGLDCEALVINNATPPTAPINYYSDWNEYGNLHIRGANIDTWGYFEDAHDSSTPFSYQSINGAQTESLLAQGKTGSYPNITAIYVPDSAVNTYKTTTGYASVADKIHPISDLTKYATRAAWEAAGKPNTALIEEYM